MPRPSRFSPEVRERAIRMVQEQTRLKELERENRELRRANEILKKASAYFALPLCQYE